MGDVPGKKRFGLCVGEVLHVRYLHQSLCLGQGPGRGTRHDLPRLFLLDVLDGFGFDGVGVLQKNSFVRRERGELLDECCSTVRLSKTGGYHKNQSFAGTVARLLCDSTTRGEGER